jgi:capsular polysaccharide biosynthesis protein
MALVNSRSLHGSRAPEHAAAATQPGIDPFLSALRRAAPLILGLMLLGLLAVNAISQLQGARYSATARVLVPSTSLSSVLAGSDAGADDPERVLDTAADLAATRDVYEIAAREGTLGSASELRSATTVSASSSSDILSFTAERDDAALAARSATAVAQAYIQYRNSLLSDAVTGSLDKLRERVAALPAESPERAELQAQVNRLETLNTLGGTGDVLVDAPSAGSQTSPAPARDSFVGLALGLIVGLLLVALREALDRRARSPEDVEELLGMPVLATVAGTRDAAPARAAADPAYAALAARLSDRWDELGGGDGTTADGAPAGAVAVTSVTDGEERTSAAVNLALAAARQGRDVVLADLDLNRTPTARALGISPNGATPATAADHLVELPLDAGDASGERRYSGSLRVLPAGSVELADPAVAPVVLRALRERGDLLIIDAPAALLDAQTRKAFVADVVIVAVPEGSVSSRTLRDFGRRAAHWPGRPAGAVLTASPTGRARFPGG